MNCDCGCKHQRVTIYLLIFWVFGLMLLTGYEAEQLSILKPLLQKQDHLNYSVIETLEAQAYIDHYLLRRRSFECH